MTTERKNKEEITADLIKTGFGYCVLQTITVYKSLKNIDGGRKYGNFV